MDGDIDFENIDQATELCRDDGGSAQAKESAKQIACTSGIPWTLSCFVFACAASTALNVPRSIAHGDNIVVMHSSIQIGRNACAAVSRNRGSAAMTDHTQERS